MNKERNHKRLSRTERGLLIAGIIVVVSIGGWFGIQAWLGHAVTKLLEREPINLDGGSYAAKVKKVRVNLMRRSVTLTGVTVGTARQGRTKKNGPVPVLNASIGKINASGIHSRREEGDSVKTLVIRNLAVESPEIIYEGIPSPAADSTDSSGERTGKNRKIAINSLSLKNGNLNIGTWKGQDQNRLSVSSLDLTFGDLALEGGTDEGHGYGNDKDQISKKLETLLSSSPRIRIQADSIAYTFRNGAMKLEIDTLVYNSADGVLSAVRAALLPQYSKYQYSLRVADHADWMELVVKNIYCTGLKPAESAGEGLIRADSVSVGAVWIDSYKDRNQPQSQKVKPTLYESVERLPIGISIPVIDARGIDIRYEEVSKGATVPGVITFTDMDARIEGLTNRPRKPSQQYTIDARGYLLGSALVNAVLTLPADSLDNRFSIRATVGPMSATIASPVTEPIANIRIVSGNVQSVSVEISGNSYQAQSIVEMRYNDLRIAIMRKNDPDKEREFLTAIANDLVLRRNNPQGDRFRIGRGTYERDPYKSFWNYIWKTSFAGVTDVIM